MDPRFVESSRAGSFAGAFAAAAATVEILTANARTINPASAAVLGLLWIVAGTAAGAGLGWLGGRCAATFRRAPAEGGVGLAGIGCGHLFLPVTWGPLFGIALLVLRWLRRRLFRKHSRLDLGIPPLVALGAGLLLLESMPPVSPFPGPERALAPIVPLPGSIPVTVSVHTEPGFPDIPALHVPLRRLASEDAGQRAALWSGRAPARTRSGVGTPRRLPGGGGVSWSPDRPAARTLLPLFPAAAPETPPFETRATLTRIAEAAGIPVLHTPPSDGDPPLYLRILDGDVAPDPETGARLRAAGSWIDVTFAEDRTRLAVTGEGFSLEPVVTLASVLDVVPTAVHLLGLPVPRACDGRVLVELMDSESAAARPLRYTTRTSVPPEG